MKTEGFFSFLFTSHYLVYRQNVCILIAAIQGPEHQVKYLTVDIRLGSRLIDQV